MKEKKIVKSFVISQELWDNFYKKYRKNAHEVLREMIRKDLKEKERGLFPDGE